MRLSRWAYCSARSSRSTRSRSRYVATAVLIAAAPSLRDCPAGASVRRWRNLLRREAKLFRRAGGGSGNYKCSPTERGGQFVRQNFPKTKIKFFAKIDRNACWRDALTRKKTRQ